jgi:hypothetical protein
LNNGKGFCLKTVSNNKKRTLFNKKLHTLLKLPIKLLMSQTEIRHESKLRFANAAYPNCYSVVSLKTPLQLTICLPLNKQWCRSVSKNPINFYEASHDVRIRQKAFTLL